MEYLIRFATTHETFRPSEVEALSRLAGLPCEILSYDDNSPFCLVTFPTLVLPPPPSPRRNLSSAADGGVGGGEGLVACDSEVDARVRAFASRSILSKSIYEVWGQGQSYEQLHADVRQRSRHLWDAFRHVSFRFSVDCYGSTRDEAQQVDIINSFRYLNFQGRIKMKNPDAEFAVLEEWMPSTATQSEAGLNGGHTPEFGATRTAHPVRLKRVVLARKIGDTCRWIKDKHDLKKRPYISTTSMDAELALLTANLALASSGKIFLDPFVGTGGFMVAAAEFGAVVLGSDIDGRSFRGKGEGVARGVGANLHKYGLTHLFGDCLTSDLTNTPFRTSTTVLGGGRGRRWLDGIICDPPYGVREGLKVLGTKFRPSRPPASGVDGAQESTSSKSNAPLTETLINGVPAHKIPGYVAPKKPYSFMRMLDDILDFAARTLVDGGRLAFWMPSANENEAGEEEATVIPTHPHLELKHECVQRFNKWSRRLLVYERLPGRLDVVDCTAGREGVTAMIPGIGYTADELNPFRKRYFQPSSTPSDRHGS